MSKAGVSVRSGNVEAVTEVKRKRKRVEIVKITVDGPDGHPVEVDAKECTKCGEVKALTEFGVRKEARSGVRSACRLCVRSLERERYVPKSGRRRTRASVITAYINGEKVEAKKCTSCNEIKVITEFRQHNPLSKGRRNDCRKCERVKKIAWIKNNPQIERESRSKWRKANRDKMREIYSRWRRNNIESARRNRRTYYRKYYETNKRKILEKNKEWLKNNPNAVRAKDHRRLAMKRELPAFVMELDFNDNMCVLSGEYGSTHLDHFVPLSWGHGGTYVGNMIILDAQLNVSKNNEHPYEWFDANKDRFNLSESAWNEMTATLASQNGLTPSEFRAFVDWCYANKRTVAQTKRDNERYGYKKPSLEIWREATGLQFPIRVDFGTSTQLSAIGEYSTASKRTDCASNPDSAKEAVM